MKHVQTRCLANRIRSALATLLVSATLFGQALHSAAASDVEILRDPWGTPHIFAAAELDGFFGLGYAAAEDRLLQMELIRRKAAGRLAEVFGPDWVDADREARIAGHAPYAPRAFARLPARWQEALRAYAAGVNAWREAHPDAVGRRFKPLGIEPEPWTPADCLLAARGVLSLGSPFSAGPVEEYHRFSELVARVGEANALRQSGLVIDDSAAIVSEADMAKDAAVYQRLKQRPHMPGFDFRPAGSGDEGRKMSHAWAVSGRKSTTGKPILESDPQLPLSSPPFLYEFHLAAGKIQARGVGVPGCPGLFIGWNRRVAWGVSALGVDSHVVFLDRLTPDGKGYVFEDKSVPFERRLERIEVKGGQPVIQEVLTSRHGTVFNSLVRSPRAGEAYLHYDAQTMDNGASARMMLEVMDAGNWSEFRRALEHHYSPGAHVVYADADGNVGYHTMVHRPLTPQSPRRALEGWTGRDEVRGRIPFNELPHLLNPESGYVSHANNLPVGSWYPYDLGLATGGTGHTSRSLRLQELLKGDGKFSVDDFERVIHRDDVNQIVAILLPIARKVVEEDRVSDAAVLGLLDGVKGWDMHGGTMDRFPAARGLGNTLTPYRGSGLNGLYGAGSGGVANLARAIGGQFAAQGTTPTNTLIRAYLVNWLRASANANGRSRDGATASDEWNARLAQGRPAARDAERTITIPYQRTSPLNLPVVDPSLDILSPPLTCLDTGTIWSQPGNIYSQIVNLADVDNSRSMIAPGDAEDGPFRTNQVNLWVRGTMHPAPLSRAKVEALGGKAQNLTAVAYSGAVSSPQSNVREAPREASFMPAIPPDACPPNVPNLAAMADEPDIIPLIRTSYQRNRLFPVGHFDSAKWRQYRWAYFRMIELVDAQIAKVLQSLRATGHERDTVVVFTSDHGDCQGAHGWNQKTVLFDESSRIPLIVCPPGLAQARTSDALVNLGLDLLPTLCQYGGVAAPAALPGIGLRDATAGSARPRPYIVVENKMVQGDPVDGVKPEPSGRMVRSRRFKYCAYDMGARRESLVDMDRDPGELVNLAGVAAFRDTLREHRQYLAEWCRTTADAFVVPST